MNTLKERLKKEEGAALALVLVMVVLLSLWLMSVSILTQSSNAAINQTLIKSAQKSAAVALAVQSSINCAQALPDANGAFDFPGCATRTNGYLVGSYANPCTAANLVNDIDYSIKTAVVNQANNSIGETLQPGKIKVNCINSPNSGVVEPLASYMLVGTSTTGTIGVDSGLQVSNCSSTLNLNGGLLNSSSRWNVDSNCGTILRLAMTNNSDSQHVPQIKTAAGGCAAIKPYVNAADLASKYPSCDENFLPAEMDPTVVNSTVAGYIQYQNSYISPVYGVASFSSSTCRFTSGIIDSTVLATINSSLSSGSGCGSRSDRPIYFGQSNKFVSNGGAPLVLNIPSNKYFVSANYSSNNGGSCNGSAGTQLVFAGATSINVQSGGRLRLCPVNSSDKNSFGQTVDKPVIITCNVFFGAPCSLAEDFVSQPGTAFLTIASGGYLTADGLVFAPSGWGKINWLTGAIFPKGIMLKALQLVPSGTSASSSTSAAANPCNGDRCLQLKIGFSPDSVSGATVPYGLVQIRMRDNFLGFNNFGKSVSQTSGTYRIDLWDLQRAS